MLILALLGCTDGGHMLGDMDAAYSLGAHIPNVVQVAWESPESGVSYVEWGPEDDLHNKTPSKDVAVGDLVETLVLGPPSGEQVTFRAVVELEDGERIEGPLESLFIPLAPAEMPAVYASGTPGQPGYLLTSLIGEGNTYLVILNAEGQPIWYFRTASNQLVTTAELRLDGGGVLAMGDVVADGGGLDMVYSIGWDGRVTQEMILPNGHHDFAQLEDGRIAWIQQELGEVAMDGEIVAVASDAVRISEWGEVADVNSPPLFSILRDQPRAADLPMCSHEHQTLFANGLEVYDWSHANSLSYDPSLDELLLLTHHIDEALVISAVDGFLEREIQVDEGDPNDDEGDAWSHGHASEMTRDRLLIFDNGLHYSPPRSRVVLYDVQPSTGALEQKMEIWEPQGRVVQALGDVVTLSSGDTLVSWSTLGRIDELNGEGEAVWSLSTAVGTGTGRVVWMNQLP